MARDYAFTVGPADEGSRLDVYLQARLPQEISRAMIQRAVRDERIRVNQLGRKSNYRVRSGDLVEALIEELPPKPGDFPLHAQAIPLEVAYEDEAVLVVNKPSGLVTHPAPGNWSGTLVNAVLWHLAGGQPEAGEPLPRAGIVHRLDKETSGLLLIAKTERAHHLLGKQLKDRSLKRGYVALVDGLVAFDEGSIDAAIARHPVHRKQMSIQMLGGRPSRTHYQVIQRHAPAAPPGASPYPRPYTVMDIELETGRTHQIRVHFAHIGHPVLGDAVYGRALASTWKAAGFARQCLHAWRLRFRHPEGGHYVVVYAPLPADIVALLDAPTRAWFDREMTAQPPGFWRPVRKG